ncbi:MAG: hypothetical protein H6Q17_166 [Bacteroidetes bacterium]|nr:hypothetical protein [Bacteroidota bacterium]
MEQLTVYQVDSFTKEKFKGNPAGVVVNADGLSETQMLAIARELNNSETAFLFSSDDSNCDGKIRYFTPTREVPTCGHATIAAMYAKALEENIDSCVLKYKTQIGILPFEIIRNKEDYQIIMTQGKFELSPSFDFQTTQRIVTALGLTDDDIDRRCPIQIASTGHSKVMIGIKSRKTLNRLTPNFNDLAKLSKVINCNGFFVFTFDSDTENILTHGRMFAPAIGINEDPVTGNANGPLGGYLIANKLAKTDNSIFEFNGMQGEQIGRPGIITVKVIATDDAPFSIQIKGDATVAFKTTIEI